jgi:hypothetical protein
MVVVVLSSCHDDSSAPTSRWTARGERAGGWRRSPRSRIRSPRRTTATPRRCARDRFPALHRARDPDARPRDARFAAALIHLYAARRRSPPTFPSAPPVASQILGEEVSGEGVVTRRHTLGRKLTFVDITVPGPGRVPSTARPSSRDGVVDDDVEHFVFVKAWGAVPKRARVGATVRFAGRLLRPREERPRDIEAAAVRPGSYHASVPEGRIEVTVPATAADVPNARAFLPSDVPASASASARTAPGRVGPISATRNGTTTSVARLCKSLVVNGACGDPNCAKRHDATPGEIAAVAAGRRDARRRSRDATAREFDPDDPHASETRASKQHSDRIFADWLVRTFDLESREHPDVVAAAGWRGPKPVDEDASGAGAGGAVGAAGGGAPSRPSSGRRAVADIAGGGGTLSFELHVRHGLECVLVDPRQVSLSPRQRNAWRNLRRRAAVAGSGTPAWDAHERAARWVRVAEEEETRRRRSHLERVLVNTGEDAEALAGPGFRPGSGPGPGTRSPENLAGFEHVEAEFWGDVTDPVGRRLATCDVLVGMHPDQATEAIVDAALALGKPFAVVPCCVFPELFPDRRRRDGAEVREYVDFVEYLRAKDPEIRIGYLPFEGRSRVLYKL